MCFLVGLFRSSGIQNQFPGVTHLDQCLFCHTWKRKWSAGDSCSRGNQRALSQRSLIIRNYPTENLIGGRIKNPPHGNASAQNLKILRNASSVLEHAVWTCVCDSDGHLLMIYVLNSTVARYLLLNAGHTMAFTAGIPMPSRSSHKCKDKPLRAIRKINETCFEF